VIFLQWPSRRTTHTGRGREELITKIKSKTVAKIDDRMGIMDARVI
jgi:hypothetical protein